MHNCTLRTLFPPANCTRSIKTLYTVHILCTTVLLEPYSHLLTVTVVIRCTLYCTLLSLCSNMFLQSILPLSVLTCILFLICAYRVGILYFTALICTWLYLFVLNYLYLLVINYLYFLGKNIRGKLMAGFNSWLQVTKSFTWTGIIEEKSCLLILTS